MKTLQKLFSVLALFCMIAAVAPAQEIVGPGYTKLQQRAGTPWQLGGDWKFNSSSTASPGFDVRGISYYRVLWVPIGTVSGCSLSIDSATTLDPVLGTLVSPTIGGILSAATIGSCATPNEYITTAAAGISLYGQITPTITGTGSVVVVVFGYSDNPAAGSSGGGGNVVVTNSPTVVATQANGANLHVDVDNNQTPITGALNNSSSPTCTGASVGGNGVNVATGGASTVFINVTTAGTGSIGFYYSPDGTNYYAIPSNVVSPPGGGASVTAISTTGRWQAVGIAGMTNFMACGQPASGTYTINLQASLGVTSPIDDFTPADAAATPTNAIVVSSWPEGWNGSTSDRLRTAGIGNTVASTGILATSPYCEFLTALPTLTTGTYGAAECDAKAQLFVDLNYYAGSQLGAAANYGTSPGAVLVPAVNAFVTNNPSVKVTGNGGASADATLAPGTAPTNGWGFLGQYKVTPPAPADTNTTSMQQDQVGDTLVHPGVQFKAGTAWNNATSINTLQYPTGTATQGQLSGAPAEIVQLDQTTTVTGGAVTWQGTFDNVNWVTIPVAQVLNPNTLAQLTNPYTFVASTNQPFLILNQGYISVRANLTTLMTGTGTITPEWTTLPLDPEVVTLLAGGTPLSTILTTGNFNSLQVAVAPPSSGGSALSMLFYTNATFGVANVKALAGNVIALAIANNTAATCYLELFNTAGTPTLGTSVIVNIPIGPNTGPPTILSLAPYTENFATGIGVGGATASGGASTCSLSGTLWYR